MISKFEIGSNELIRRIKTKMVVHLLVNLCIILIIVNSVDSSPITSTCDQGVNFRDSRECFKYYSCVRNSEFNVWEFEEQICDESLYFEPTLNRCVPDEKLITKCQNIHAVHSERMTKDLKPQNREMKVSEDELMNDLSKDLAKDINQDLDKDSNSTTDDKQLLSPLRRRKPNGKQSNGSDTKRRKNSRMPTKRKRNKKNWIAIFVRGCNSVSSPYDEDYDQQPDEQIEEDEDQNNDANDQDTRPLDENKEKNRPNLNENEKKSKNCSCEDKNQSATTNKSDLNNLVGNNSTTPVSVSPSTSDPSTTTAKSLDSSNITSSDQNLSTPSNTTHLNSSSTVPIDNNLVSSTPTSINSLSTTTTTVEPTNVSTRSTTIKSQSTTTTTTTKPQLLSTSKPVMSTSKPKPSRIVLIPKVMKNPHNNRNDSAKIDEKELLKKFLDELKKKRTLTKDNEVELIAMFKEKLEEKKQQRKPSVLKPKQPELLSQPMIRTVSSSPFHEQENRNKKINKIKDELDLKDLDSTVNYYANLADQNHLNSTSNSIPRA